jgi:hypothetical protein
MTDTKQDVSVSGSVSISIIVEMFLFALFMDCAIERHADTVADAIGEAAWAIVSADECAKGGQ